MKFALLSILFVVVLMSCSKKTPVSSGPDPDPEPPPSGPLTYSGTIQPIFNSRCVTCHSTSNPSSGVRLNSHAATMASQGVQYNRLIVVAGNADESPLYDKLQSNPQFGSRMPEGSSLTTQQINAIRDWINTGAPNN